MLKKIVRYLNPIDHLGDRNYSYIFPIVGTVSCAILVELYVNLIIKDPEAVGMPAIVLFLFLIIYYSFREGVRGGFITTSLTVMYYAYIIYTHNYKGARLTSGVETTFILAGLYLIMAAVIGWLKQTIDVLIEKEADERKRLQTIIQQLPVGVIITDHNGKVVQVNKKIDSILGMKIPIGYRIGSTSLLESQSNGKPVGQSQGPLAHTLATGKPVVSKEFVIQRKDKKQVYVQVNAAAVHNRSGQIIAAASIISDVTQQKEHDARKDDFVNMASHELKTPITSMKLYIESLLNRAAKQDDAVALKMIHNIKDQTERLQKLVNDLLDVSRLQTGKLSFDKETFPMDHLITEVIEALQGSTKGHQLKFAKKITVAVHADKFRIYQVLTNLITNAIKYSPSDTDIIIKIQKHDGKLLVSVQDFGMGIEKSQQKKIFERLYQVRTDKEKTFPGFGMGLYISKEIISRHKGKIWVESEQGNGSTFYFTLPLSV